jgi:UDP-N-acetylglucosamine transferase subunit ALG13
MKLVNQINRLFIQKFDYCWVPDFENSLLSGELSDFSLKKTFIGPLTRFKKSESERKKYKYKYLAIISGPEPQRSLLEDEIQNCFGKTNEHCAIINGLTKTKETSTGKITFYPHLETTTFKEILIKSELVICRSGFSSIMDLYVLQKKVLLIPTPGQTEQEYLAKYHQETHSICYQKQGEINLKKASFNFIKPKYRTKKKLLKAALGKMSL